MIISNHDTVKNGVDIVKIEFPDNFFDFYYILRTRLVKRYGFLIPDAGYPYKGYYENLTTKAFIQSLLEKLLELPSKGKFIHKNPSESELEDLYKNFLSGLRELDAQEILERLKIAIEMTVNAMVSGDFRISPAFYIDVMREFVIFDIVGGDPVFPKVDFDYWKDKESRLLRVAPEEP